VLQEGKDTADSEKRDCGMPDQNRVTGNISRYSEDWPFFQERKKTFSSCSWGPEKLSSTFPLGHTDQYILKNTIFPFFYLVSLLANTIFLRN
jgi:hypothetical protein